MWEWNREIAPSEMHNLITENSFNYNWNRILCIYFFTISKTTFIVSLESTFQKHKLIKDKSILANEKWKVREVNPYIYKYIYIYIYTPHKYAPIKKL